MTNFGAYSDKISREEEKKMKLFQQKCAQSTNSLTNSVNNSNAPTMPVQEPHHRIDAIRHIRLTTERYTESLYNFFGGLVIGLLLASVAFMLIWVAFGGRTGARLAGSGGASIGSSSAHGTTITSNTGVSLLRKKFAKPIESWTCLEIQEWLYSLGPWTYKIASVANRFKIGISIFINKL